MNVGNAQLSALLSDHDAGKLRPEGFVQAVRAIAALAAPKEAGAGPLIESPYFPDVESVVRYMDDLANVVNAITGDEGEDDPLTVLQRYAANPPGDQRQEEECNCHEGNGARNCLIHTQADFDAQQSPPPEAAAAVGGMIASVLWEETTMPQMTVDRVTNRILARITALAAPTGPQPAGGGVDADAVFDAWRDLAIRAWQLLDVECPNAPITDELLAAIKGDSHAG